MAGKCRKHHPICIHLLGINNRKRLKPHQIQTTEQKDMTGEPKSQLHLLSLRSQPSGSTTHHQGPVTAWGKDGTFPQAQPWEMHAVSPYQKKVPTQCISLHHQNQKYQVTSSVVIPQNPSGVDWAATGKYGPPWAVCFFFYCLRLSFAYANPRQSLCQHNHSLRGHSCIVYAYSKPAQLLPATKTYLKLTAQNTYAELQEVGSKPTSNPYWWYIKIPCLDTSMEGSQAQLLQKGLIHGGLELTPTGRLVPSP